MDRSNLGDAAFFYPDLLNPNSVLYKRTQALIQSEAAKGNQSASEPWHIRDFARQAWSDMAAEMRARDFGSAELTPFVPPPVQQSTPKPETFEARWQEGWEIACTLYPVLETRNCILLREANAVMQKDMQAGFTSSSDPTRLLLAIESAAQSLKQKSALPADTFVRRINFLAANGHQNHPDVTAYFKSQSDNQKPVPVPSPPPVEPRIVHESSATANPTPSPRSETVSTKRHQPTEQDPVASGTGFIITDDGFIVTNHHVIDDAEFIKVRIDDELHDAKLVKTDSTNDLAVLKVRGSFNALPVSTSRDVSLGDSVATVGFPNILLQGLSPKLSKGDICCLSGIQDDPRHFQISVPVQPGNSGGPLVDTHGNVIGVVSHKLSQKAALRSTGTLAENVNYAIKSTLLLSLLESIPDASAKLKAVTREPVDFRDVVKLTEKATVLVLVY